MVFCTTISPCSHLSKKNIPVHRLRNNGCKFNFYEFDKPNMVPGLNNASGNTFNVKSK